MCMADDFSGFQVLGRLRAKGMLQKLHFRGGLEPQGAGSGLVAPKGGHPLLHWVGVGEGP